MKRITVWRNVAVGVFAAAAVGFVGAAQATDYTTNVGVIAPNTPYTQVMNHLAPVEPMGTSFMDLFNFQVGGSGFSSVAVNLALSPYLNISNLQLGLYSGQNALGGLLVGPVGSGVTLSQMLMTNTDYSLKVTGVTSGTLGGSYTLAIAAVPEAQNWLMMLSGLSMLGLIAWRSGRV